MLIERDAVRAVLLTPRHEVLMMMIREPTARVRFWITPGGGLEVGESPEQGLRRELQEELGLTEFVIGPLVCRRDHTFNWCGRRLRQRERLYLVPVERFDPLMVDPVELTVLQRFHWWPLHELAATSESVTPRALASIVQRYIERGAPSDPHVEVLVD